MITTLIDRILASWLPAAEAHCDTADGPAVTDGRRALDTGQLAPALKWIPASGEDELRAVFTKSVAVRQFGPDAADIADRLFLETLVRLHRLAEGVGFTGIQASGTEIPAVVVEADRALDTGDLTPVLHLVPVDRHAELSRRFELARSAREFAVDDVEAGRAFVAAYVAFFTYAEGHEGHDHHEHHSAAAHRSDASA